MMDDATFATTLAKSRRGPQKPVMWCPDCDEEHPCLATQPEFGNASSRNGYCMFFEGYTKDEPPTGFWRTRECSVCGNVFNTLEVDIGTLLKYIEKVVQENTDKILRGQQEETDNALKLQILNNPLNISVVFRGRASVLVKISENKLIDCNTICVDEANPPAEFLSQSIVVS